MQICIHMKLTKASEPSFEVEGGDQGQMCPHQKIPIP